MPFRKSPFSLSSRSVGVDWTVLLPVLLPVAWSSLGLKLIRLRDSDLSLTGWQVPMALRSEALVCLAFLLLASGFGAARLSARWRQITFALLQAFAAAVIAGNVLAHYFYQAVAFGLSWRILAHGWSVFMVSPEVIQSEVPLTAWSLLATGVALSLGGPYLLGRARRSCGVECEPRRDRRPLVGLLLALSGTGAIVAASKPVSWIADPGLNRDQSLHLLIGALSISPPPEGGTTSAAFTTSNVELKQVAGEAPTNLVLIILESTRASAVTPYNPKFQTTPYINTLAAKSLFFEDVSAVIPHTSKALVAIHCGVPPRPTMAIREANYGGLPARCLPHLLADHNYQSVFFQSATEKFEKRRRLVDNLGFDEFYPLESLDIAGFERANYFGYEDNVMLAKSEAWLKQRSHRVPFLATYLTLTPHHDYRAPKRYGRLTFDENVRFNRYLNSVRYLDHFVKNLIDQYKKLRVYESTLFVIVGDHGEAFGEHDRVQHDNVPYQEGLHVPLLVHDGRGKLAPHRIGHPMSQIDLLPTIVELLEFEVLRGRFPGVPISQLGPERPLYFACWFEKQCVGVRLGSGKFIHHFGHRPDEFFDLEDDPGETENMIGAFPGDAGDITEDLHRWLAAVAGAYRAPSQYTASQGLD